MIRCPVCGTEHPDNAVRCDGTYGNDTRCGKDLTGVSKSAGGGRAVIGGDGR